MGLCRARDGHARRVWGQAARSPHPAVQRWHLSVLIGAGRGEVCQQQCVQVPMEKPSSSKFPFLCRWQAATVKESQAGMTQQTDPVPLQTEELILMQTLQCMGSWGAAWAASP